MEKVHEPEIIDSEDPRGPAFGPANFGERRHARVRMYQLSGLPAVLFGILAAIVGIVILAFATMAGLALIALAVVATFLRSLLGRR